MLTFTQVSPVRYEAQGPVDWALGFRPGTRRQTRLFAVIRQDGAEWLLYIHDQGRTRRPVRVDSYATAVRVASMVAKLPVREIARLRTLSAARMATGFDLDYAAAMRLAQTMRSGCVAHFALRQRLTEPAHQTSARRARLADAPRHRGATPPVGSPVPLAALRDEDVSAQAAAGLLVGSA